MLKNKIKKSKDSGFLIKFDKAFKKNTMKFGIYFLTNFLWKQQIKNDLHL